MKSKILNISSVVVWVIFIVLLGLTFYVNHYMPRGPILPTGDYVCQNDDRGPCGPEYIEEMRDLNIPTWSKFLRRNFILFFIGLPILAMYLKEISKNDSKTKIS